MDAVTTLAEQPDRAQRTDTVARTAQLEETRRRRRRRLERVLYICSPIVFVLLWQLASRNDWIDGRFFPAPTDVYDEFVGMVSDGSLWQHFSASSQRILIGFVIGAVPGIVLGLAMGMLPLVRAAVKPLIDATFPVPKLAVLPLFILIFGVGEASKYAIIATAVFFLVLMNTVAGVKSIDAIYFDIARNYGAGRLLTFVSIALPGALPSIVAGLNIGFNVALLVIVAAEFVGAKEGIGYLIWSSWQLFAIEAMYVGLVVTAVLGLISAAALEWLERKLVPWKPRRR